MMNRFQALLAFVSSFGFNYNVRHSSTVWPVNNFYHVRRIFVNNYGRHTLVGALAALGAHAC